MLRGIEGFGLHSDYRSSLIEVLSADLPIVIEIIEEEEKIKKFLKKISPMINQGLIVMCDVEVIKHV